MKYHLSRNYSRNCPKTLFSFDSQTARLVDALLLPLFYKIYVQIGIQYPVDEPVPSEPTQERQLIALKDAAREIVKATEYNEPAGRKRGEGRPKTLTSDYMSCTSRSTSEKFGPVNSLDLLE